MPYPYRNTNICRSSYKVTVTIPISRYTRHPSDLSEMIKRGQHCDGTGALHTEDTEGGVEHVVMVFGMLCVWYVCVCVCVCECVCVCVCLCLRTVEFGDWGLVYVRLLPWKWGHLWIWGLTLKSPHFYLIFHRFRGPTSPWQSLVTVPRFEFVRSVCMAFYTFYSAVLRIIHSQYFSINLHFFYITQ